MSVRPPGVPLINGVVSARIAIRTLNPTQSIADRIIIHAIIYNSS